MLSGSKSVSVWVNSSGGLGKLESKISWSIFLVLVLSLSSISSLFVQDGEDLGNSLSNNLNENKNGQEVCSPYSNAYRCISFYF